MDETKETDQRKPAKIEDPFELDITNMLADYKKHGMLKDGKVDFVNAAMVIQGVISIICQKNASAAPNWPNTF